jgi:hypothetical protein
VGFDHHAEGLVMVVFATAFPAESTSSTCHQKPAPAGRGADVAFSVKVGEFPARLAFRVKSGSSGGQGFLMSWRQTLSTCIHETVLPLLAVLLFSGLIVMVLYELVAVQFASVTSVHWVEVIPGAGIEGVFDGRPMTPICAPGVVYVARGPFEARTFNLTYGGNVALLFGHLTQAESLYVCPA